MLCSHRLNETDHEASCTIQTVEEGAPPPRRLGAVVLCAVAGGIGGTDLTACCAGLACAADDMEDLQFLATLTNTVIIEVCSAPRRLMHRQHLAERSSAVCDSVCDMCAVCGVV